MQDCPLCCKDNGKSDGNTSRQKVSRGLAAKVRQSVCFASSSSQYDEMPTLEKPQGGSLGAAPPPYNPSSALSRCCMASSTSVCEIWGFLSLLSRRSTWKMLTVHLDMADSRSSALLV